MNNSDHQWFEPILQSGLLPDRFLRLAAKTSINRGLRQWNSLSASQQSRRKQAVRHRLDRSAIAVQPEQANRQHYEIPSEFFELVLGPWRKYSCCYWTDDASSLAEAEAAMLSMTCSRAGVQDGMRLLDLGCGWGSLSLWLAQEYPNSQITALSNSETQRTFILDRAQQAGHKNLKVLRANVAAIDLDEQFDRILSIEMFEHMRNYRQLLQKISRWLAPAGKLFVHHFSHREQLYTFDVDNTADYMARTYFAGGTMPSHDLLRHFEDVFKTEADWRVNGIHYAKTLRAWLDNLDANRAEALEIFKRIEGPRTPTQWLAYWRNFFIICEETFAIGGGDEYLVSHLLMAKPNGVN